MPRFSYAMGPDVAVEGMAHGGDLNESIGLQLERRKQVLRLTVAQGAATDDLVLTVEDVESGQTYEATATGNANEATLAANALAAIRASEINKVFSAAAVQATSGQDLIIDLTARHGGREYELSGTGGTGAITVSETVEPGGSGLEFGRMVAFGSSEGSFAQLGATDTIDDLAGLLERTEANHFRPEAEDFSTTDVCPVGTHMPIKRRRRMWVKVEEAVAVGDPVYVRRALTSSAGRLGGFRASPAGSTQVATITAVADHQFYVIEFGYLGRDYRIAYGPTDGTSTTDIAIDGLEAHAAEVCPAGVTPSAASAAATMTLTAAAGTEFDYVRNGAFGEDTAAAGTSVSLAAADVDTINISTIARWTKGAAADGLALLTLDMRAA